MNPVMDKFMRRFEFEGLTFDDVSLITSYAGFMPDDTDISARFTRNIRINVPVVSAAMDTVTEREMAIGMAMLGGVGIIHRNLTAEEQAWQVGAVKHHLHGLIRDPIVFRVTDSITSVLDRKNKKGYSFSGFPVVDGDNRVVGILTARDIKFAASLEVKVASVMTGNVITAPAGTTLQQAYRIMMRNRIGKLPLVGKDKRLTGLYSFSDVKSLVENADPMTNRDAKYRLRVGAAVGASSQDRMERLAEEDVDVVVVDSAHGDSKGVLEMIKWIKKHHPDIDVIGGNVATGESARNVLKAGADGVKVGIGPGSICTTRVVAGVGIPQITAIYEVAKAVGNSIPVIADGGVRHSGDIPKAIAAGADTVMLGSVLAGTEESPGEKIIHQGRQYVTYRGMGSLAAMKESGGSRERYQQADADEASLVPQGIEGMVPYSGPLRKVLIQYAGGLRAGLGYCGCRSCEELKKKGSFVRISLAGLAEAHPHGVTITREAPNYQRDGNSR